MDTGTAFMGVPQKFQQSADVMHILFVCFNSDSMVHRQAAKHELHGPEITPCQGFFHKRIFYAIKRQDEKGVEALLMAIKNGNKHNRYTLAGLLIRASQ